MPETVSVETANNIATVTIEKTTMPPAFFADIETMFTGFASDPDLRAVVIRASGKAFTYGLDLKAVFAEHGQTMIGGGMAKSRTELLLLLRKLQASFTAVAECPVPVIASVHGWCIGGGLDLISACDIRVASRDAKFSLRETRIAIVADMGSLQRLPPIIGQGHTRELAFTGKDIEADRALSIGLVNDLHDDRDASDAAALAIATEIAANAPLTVRGVKEVLAFGENKTAAEGLNYVATWNSAFLASEDLGEAISAFTAKRTPEYKGR